jgi:acyl-CoA thioesterase-1
VPGRRLRGVRSWGVALGALVLGSGVWLWAAPGGAEASQAERCRDLRVASAERRSTVHDDGGPRVAVIGDSWSQGSGLADPGASWPSRLDGRVVVDGFGGSGFTAQASPCLDVAFPLRVGRALATDPDLVVVQGGLNDFDVSPSVVRAGAERTLRALEGHEVVVVGPAAAPLRAAGAARVDAVLAEAAAAAGVPYVRTAGWELEYLPDRLHLTAAGHQVFGDAVREALDEIEPR